MVKKLCLIFLVMLMLFSLSGCSNEVSDFMDLDDEDLILSSLEVVDSNTLLVNFSNDERIRITDFTPSPLEVGENTVSFTYNDITFEETINYDPGYKIYAVSEELNWGDSSDDSFWDEFLAEFDNIEEQGYEFVGEGENNEEKTFTLPAGTKTILIYNTGRMRVDYFKVGDDNVYSDGWTTYNLRNHRLSEKEDNLWSDMVSGKIALFPDELNTETQFTVKTITDAEAEINVQGDKKDLSMTNEEGIISWNKDNISGSNIDFYVTRNQLPDELYANDIKIEDWVKVLDSANNSGSIDKSELMEYVNFTDFRILMVSDQGEWTVSDNNLNVKLNIDIHDYYINNGELNFHWGDLYDAEKYVIYRSSSQDGQFTKLEETTDSEYVDNTIDPDNDYYYYKIEAINNGTVIGTSDVFCGWENVAPELNGLELIDKQESYTAGDRIKFKLTVNDQGETLDRISMRLTDGERKIRDFYLDFNYSDLDENNSIIMEYEIPDYMTNQEWEVYSIWLYDLNNRVQYSDGADNYRLTRIEKSNNDEEIQKDEPTSIGIKSFNVSGIENPANKAPKITELALLEDNENEVKINLLTESQNDVTEITDVRIRYKLYNSEMDVIAEDYLDFWDENIPSDGIYTIEKGESAYWEIYRISIGDSFGNYLMYNYDDYGDTNYTKVENHDQRTDSGSEILTNIE